jgi:hypothetical protein
MFDIKYLKLIRSSFTWCNPSYNPLWFAGKMRLNLHESFFQGTLILLQCTVYITLNKLNPHRLETWRK